MRLQAFSRMLSAAGILCLIGTASPVVAQVTAESSAADKERFFEERVRPVLANHCFECHGAKKQQAGLRLDTRALLIKGGDSGKVVVPGDVEASRLIDVIRYDPLDIQMPPEEKLSDKHIEALITWVKIGAPWPESSQPSNTAAEGAGPIDFAQARASHWAYRPVKRPPLPEVKQAKVVQAPIDYFVLAKLEEQGLSLSPAADRRALIRRVTFDLTGLPPTFEEVESFVNDPSPDAFTRVVDRLLASPHYGERWARHWLDVARYADTKGYVFTEEPRYPYSYTYRDYVIRSLNDDLPYNQFLLEQLAADQLENGDTRSLAALGFLTVGRRFRNSAPDIIDDRIDVVTRGLMGLTVSCARCHDHKYDPIPTEDYYSLYGVFASSYEPELPPLIAEPEPTKAYLAYKKELDKRQAALDEYLAAKHRELLEELRSSVTDYLLQVVKTSGHGNADYGLSFSKGEPRPQVVSRWTSSIKKKSPPYENVFSLWHALAALPQEQFAAKAPEVIGQFADKSVKEAKPGGNPLVTAALHAEPPKTMFDVARVYGDLLDQVEKKWQTQLQEAASTSGKSGGTPPERLDDPAAEELRQVLYAEDSPAALSLDESQRLFDRAARNKARQLEKKISSWRVTSPDAPPRAMVLFDRENPVTPRVFIRGNSRRRGDPVERRFPQLLSDGGSGVFQKGSGRLELAQAIVDPQNPLTARVIVNRVWMHYFGEGLVRTPSDFGVRSEPPTHPQLLDYLAARFMDEGWSLKKLHRWILLSATYQQASDLRPEGQQLDPENRFLWRMPRRRLEFEAMRDALLAVSGALDPQIGGRPVELQKQPFTGRRTIYGLVDRNNLPNLFRTFDFPSPDSSSPQRPETTVPQQALFAMNSPFVVEQARRLAADPNVGSAESTSAGVRTLYRRVLSRDPSPDELSLAVEYIDSANQQSPAKSTKSRDTLSPWEQFAQILLLTNEFLYLD